MRDDSDQYVWGRLTGTEIGEAYGVGGLGLVEGGKGFGERGGGGGTSGSGFGGEGKAVPRVKQAALNFEISAEGKVARATVAESSLKDASVGTCIAAKAKRWKFPKPQGGGVVVVTYPFVLTPG